jgi:two-component system response regulator WspF
VKIGIANDMRMAQIVLKDLVETDNRHQVIWVAENGKTALESALKQKTDVILMDLLMPVMDGVQATKEIMKKAPCAILVVTSSVSGNMDKVFESMGHGALDVVKTPAVHLDSSVETQLLLSKLEIVSHLVGEQQAQYVRKKELKFGFLREEEAVDLAVLGSSTGGPMVLAEILETFPRPLPFSVVIIQHVDQEFSSAFASWLEEQVQLPICLIEEGDQPVNGKIYIAKKNAQLVIDRRGCFSYSLKPLDPFYKPSINAFFESLAERWPKKAVAALLTGMGNDGAFGLKQLQEKGWLTIAQEKESCVVFGMSKAAIELNAAQFVLAPKDIGKAIVKYFESIGGCK